MRIGFTGTVSVGKTTLVKELSQLDEFKDYYCITERSKYLNDLGIPLNTDSTLNGQTIFLAERCSELLHENLITDRTIIDVMAFTSSAKSITFDQKTVFNNFAKTLLHQYDFIFYIPPQGVEIEDNGVRETNSEYRTLIDKKINYYLQYYSYVLKNPFTTISGSTDERIKQVLNVIF